MYGWWKKNFNETQAPLYDLDRKPVIADHKSG